MNSNWKLGLAFSLTTALMWGLLPLALKNVMSVMDPITITWYRFSVSAVVALLWYGYRRRTALANLFAPASVVPSLVTVAALIVNYMLYIWGLDYLNPGASQILIQLAPLLLLIGSVAIFKEEFSTSQWLGVIALCGGMLLFFHLRLNSTGETSQQYMIGVVFTLAAAVAWSIYGLGQKKLLLKHDAKDIVLLICLAGSIFYLPLSEPQQISALTGTELALLLFCGINTIVAYGCFGLAMSYWQASRVSAIITLAPLFTLVFTAVFNQLQLAEIAAEPMDTLSYIGALVVVLGAAAAAFPKTIRNIATDIRMPP